MPKDIFDRLVNEPAAVIKSEMRRLWEDSPALFSSVQAATSDWNQAKTAALASCLNRLPSIPKMRLASIDPAEVRSPNIFDEVLRMSPDVASHLTTLPILACRSEDVPEVQAVFCAIHRLVRRHQETKTSLP